VPIKRGRQPPTRRMRSDSDPRAVVNTETAGRQRAPDPLSRTAPPSGSFL